MKNCFLTLFVFVSLTGFSQNTFKTHIDNIQGIWIEKSFKSYFDTMPSMSAYSQYLDKIHKMDFSAIPIGLRINSAEIKDNSINIGSSILHTHILFPEVSGFCVQGRDTIYEDLHFSIDLNSVDSAGYYQTSDFFKLFAINSRCHIKVNYNSDTTITVIRDKTDDFPALELIYCRIENKFSDDYPYPNPKEYYLRQKTLTGKYSLLSENKSLLTDNFEIKQNGDLIGNSEWKGLKINFNSDVFCGGPIEHDGVIIYDPEHLYVPETKFYIYEKQNNEIYLYGCTVDCDAKLIKNLRYILIEKQ